MKKIFLLIFLISITSSFAQSRTDKMSYFGINVNYIPDSEYPYGGGACVAVYTDYIFYVVNFSLPGFMDIVPFVGYRETNHNTSWYVGAAPYDYCNIWIKEVSGPGDGFALTGGYNYKNLTASLTTVAVPYSKESNTFGVIHARLAYNIGDSWGVAYQYNRFNVPKNAAALSMSAFQLYFNL